MANINARRPLSRRHLLRGMGAASIGLPFLEAMTCSLGQRTLGNTPATEFPRRFVALNAGLGFHAPHLFPQSPGRLTPTTPYLIKLKEHLDQITLFSGLSHPEQQGNNGHASEMTILTSAQRPGLAGFRNTISLDQQIASQIGLETRFPFLAVSARGTTSLSWTANGVAIPAESSAESLFKAMFVEGTPEEIEKEVEGIRRGRSILDTVTVRAKELERQISQQDRQKLDQYLSSVRDLEIRLQQSEGWVRQPKPKVNANPPEDVQEKNAAIARQKLLYDIVVKAFQTDSTRTITFNLGSLNAVPDVPGVTSDWHGLSHHGKDPGKIDELKLVEEAEFSALSTFLTELRSIKENAKNLLDHTVVLFGSNLGNASAHDWHNLPILVAGGGYHHGNYVAHDAKNNTPLANLFVALAQYMGVETDQFGSSNASNVRGLER